MQRLTIDCVHLDHPLVRGKAQFMTDPRVDPPTERLVGFMLELNWIQLLPLLLSIVLVVGLVC